ncbi:MAG TPA: hypothetical protein VL069_16555, partial [Opitutus sp.]|nr:hypothetical protein [Opitutus sp.]
MSRSRQPWPMKWIVLIVLLVIGPYTFLRWHYRKPQPAFEPYHDIKDRANTMRLVSAGFQRVTLTAVRPAEPLRLTSVAAITPAPGGLPAALSSTLVDQPQLPSEILSVSAPAETNTFFEYILEFTCAVADNQEELGNAYLYAREEQIYIVPEIEPLSGELLTRNRENLVRLTVR